MNQGLPGLRVLPGECTRLAAQATPGRFRVAGKQMGDGWSATCPSMHAKCGAIPKPGRSLFVPTRVGEDSKLARKVSMSTQVNSCDGSVWFLKSMELPA